MQVKYMSTENPKAISGNLFYRLLILYDVPWKMDPKIALITTAY